MVQPNVSSWLSRLRFTLAYPPWLLLSSGFLLLIAGCLQLIVLPRLEARIEASELNLRQIERANRRAQFERTHSQASPENIRLSLLDQFPDDAHLHSELGRLLELADREGLQLSAGEYRLVNGKDKLVDKYVLNLPLQGSYREIRQYLARLRSAFPTLAIEDISLRRNNIGQSRIDAQLRLVMFIRSREPK